MIGVLSNLPLPEDVINLIYEYKWGDPKEKKKKFMESMMDEQRLYLEIFYKLAFRYQFIGPGKGARYYDINGETIDEKIIKYILIPKINMVGWKSYDFRNISEHVRDVIRSLNYKATMCSWNNNPSPVTRTEMKLVCRLLTKIIIKEEYDIHREENFEVNDIFQLWLRG